MKKHNMRGWLMWMALIAMAPAVSQAGSALEALCDSPDQYGCQTCNDAIRPSTPDSRYKDNGNGTITDLATGLMWQRCPAGLSGATCTTGEPVVLTWQEALQYATEAEFAGYRDWRLPNVTELLTLVERRCSNPPLNGRVFPFEWMGMRSWTRVRGFWSSTAWDTSGSFFVQPAFVDKETGAEQQSIPNDEMGLRLVRDVRNPSPR